MSKKIDERIPREAGRGALPDYPAIKTPWDRLISYHETVHFCTRLGAIMGAGYLEALRILVPDYEKRCEVMCKLKYQEMYAIFSSPMGPKIGPEKLHVHPFCAGNFTGSLNGDSGDERYLMPGRVQDFGTHRVEKELDECPWEICGSEICRATTSSLQGVMDGYQAHLKKGPRVELNMVEAKACGDRHCRIVGEDRQKFPMPERPMWDCFGPIATYDMVKDTEEAYCVSESMIFREESDYRYTSGTCFEEGPETALGGCARATAVMYVIPALKQFISDGTVTEEFTLHVLRCVFEAMGKAAFADAYTKAGLKNWMAVPEGINDGRLMGGYIETVLSALLIPYEVEAFNSSEVIYLIDRDKLLNRQPEAIVVQPYLALWNGQVKTLLNAQWAVWEEGEGAPAEKLRLKIAKKIDKFC